jgi:hypothetical protein
VWPAGAGARLLYYRAGGFFDCQKTTDDKSARARALGDSRHLMFAGRTPRVIFSKWLTPLFVGLLGSTGSVPMANIVGNINAWRGVLAIVALLVAKLSRLLKCREVCGLNGALLGACLALTGKLALVARKGSAQSGDVSLNSPTLKIQSSLAGRRNLSLRRGRSPGGNEKSESAGSFREQVSTPSMVPCSACQSQCQCPQITTRK